MNMKQNFLVYKGLPRDVYLLFIATVINKIGSFIAPLMTLILTIKIGFSASEAGLFSTIAMLTQAPFITIGGYLADKFGSKYIIIIFQFVGALIYIICGFMEPNFTVAILLIITSNIYAVAAPALNAIVPAITPAPLVKNAYSLMYLGLNLGLAVGPTIGGALFTNHLNLLFILNSIATILSTALILFFVSTKEDKSKVSLTREETEQNEVSKSNSVFSFLYNNPVLLVFSIVMMIFNFCYIQWTFLLPLQTTDIFGDKGVSFYTLLLSANAIIVIILTPVITSMTQSLDPVKSFFVGGLFYLSSYLLFAVNNFLAIFIVAIILMTIGEILISINTNNYIANLTPKKYLGRAISIIFMVNGVGYAIGPAIMGKVIEFTNFTSAWFIVAAIMVGGTVSLYFVKRLEKINTLESLDESLLQNKKEKIGSKP